MSEAVGLERISTIVGYQILKGNFQEGSPNLPISIAILGEANHDNQSSLDLAPKEITSAKQAGVLYGYGSPIYHIMRILRPVNGGSVVGGIPTVVYPQAEAGGATSKKIEITPVGTATENATHTLKIAGRTGLEGVFYDIQVNIGDTTADITQKIEDAINNVLGSPVKATSTAYEAELETKWKGLTADEVSVSVLTNDKPAGITYTINSTQSGAGTPSVASALSAFGSKWHNIVINSYGTQSDIMSALEAFNGQPTETPTGRYAGIVFKPFIALTGSTADDPTAITDARPNDVTIAICPAPNSTGLQFEAAANMCALFARVSQDTPHLDVQNKSYPDMPAPSSAGSMEDYENRDLFVKKGCSTVDLVSGVYVVKDFVTTYHPEGETPPQFRYCRNLILDFNVRYGYYLLEATNVLNHTIAKDNDTVVAAKVIKPKQWKQILFAYAEDLAARALVVDVPFMQESVSVSISTSNPDRLQTFFRYKRSGFARISSTIAEAGFNFGTINV